MRKTFIISAVAVSLAASAVVWAGTATMTKPAGGAVPMAVAPGNSTAYERAVTAYLDNVVEKARKKLPNVPAAPQEHHEPGSMGPDYPQSASMEGGSLRPTLPRVERITIGLKSRAVLETPNGGMLRVSPGVETPYGQVTEIRAAGVWFRMRGSREAVELADISPDDSGNGKGGPNTQQISVPGAGQMVAVPPPPNFQSSPHP
ncbi:MAG: hypothetical protein ACYCV6_02700 [Steroidobacteraceae bacterium]